MKLKTSTRLKIQMRDSTPKISIIIPNLNGKNLLKKCFDSLHNQTFSDYEIILVDNGSTDGSVKFVQENYEDVRIISFPINKGFCKAVNEGIKNARGEFIVLLNNDTEVDKNWLEELYKAAIANPEISFYASKILFFNQRNVIFSAGDFCRPEGRPHGIGYGQNDEGQFDRVQKVFGASGAAAFYRKSLFADIGLFDEDFFAFYEDVDFSFRAQLKGHQCLYVPTAIVYHYGGATIKRQSPNNIYYLSRNEINLLIKNMPFVLLMKYLPRIILIHFFKPFYILIKYGFNGFLAFIKGRISAITQLRVMLKKRKDIQKSRKVPISYIDSLLIKKIF